MIEFVMGVVQAVMGGVLSDLINNRRSAVRRAEIEAAVEATVRERQDVVRQEDHAALVKQVMTELVHVVRQDPDLKWRLSALRLAHPVNTTSTALRQQILDERVARLTFLVSERRNAMDQADPEAKPGAATADDSLVEPAEPETQEPESDADVLWDTVKSDETTSPELLPDLAKLKQRVKDRRSRKALDATGRDERSDES